MVGQSGASEDVIEQPAAQVGSHAGNKNKGPGNIIFRKQLVRKQVSVHDQVCLFGIVNFLSPERQICDELWASIGEPQGGRRKR